MRKIQAFHVPTVAIFLSNRSITAAELLIRALGPIGDLQLVDNPTRDPGMYELQDLEKPTDLECTGEDRRCEREAIGLNREGDEKEEEEERDRKAEDAGEG